MSSPDISRNSFDEAKDYVRVVQQQGKPYTDYDYNEAQEIQYDLSKKNLNFIMTVNSFNEDGYKIIGSGLNNNFTIKSGEAIIQGNFCKKRTDNLASELGIIVSTPSSERIDYVYLDVWFEYINSQQDPNIKHQNLTIEPTQRLKIRKDIKIVEGGEIPAAQSGHIYTPLAKLVRPASKETIDSSEITDLRSVYFDYIKIKEEFLKYNYQVIQTVPKIPVPISNTDRLKTVISDIKSFIDVDMEGKMVVNLLGRDGNCEDLSKWGAFQVNLSLDSINKVFGGHSLKVTRSSVGTSGSANKIDLFSRLDASKYYLISGYIKNNDASDAKINIYTNGTGKTPRDTKAYTGTSFERRGVVLRPSDWGTGSTTVVLELIVVGTVGQSANFDGIMPKEITEEEYNTLTVDQLLTKYQYVDSAQPTQNPVINVRRKNLFDGVWELGGFTASGVEQVYADRMRTKSYMPVKPNTMYAFKVYGTGGNAVVAYDENKNPLFYSYSSGDLRTYTTPNNVRFLRFLTLSIDLATLAQLEEGTVATAYEPFRKTQTIIPTMLANIGTQKDTLSVKSGVVKKIKRIEKKILDGSLPWVFQTDYVGFKAIGLDLSNIPSYVNDQFVVCKYDGTILEKRTITPLTAKDQTLLNLSQSGRLQISIANTDSGWGDSYTPTQAEIQAYMNGWRMYAGTVTTPYNGVDTKRWAKIWCGVGTNDSGVVAGSGTTILPTTMNDMGYTPSQLFYALANPIEEIIQPIGELPLLEEGVNHVMIESGRVYERAKPKLDNNMYHINWASLITNPHLYSPLSFKVNTILEIFRNRSKDPENWIKNYSGALSYGKERCYIEAGRYDPSAEYFVEYEMLHEEYNSQVFDATISYDQNLRTALNTALEVASNMKKMVDVVDLSKASEKVVSEHLAETATFQTGVTRDISINGNQIVTLLPGRTPKKVTIYAVIGSTVRGSWGIVSQNAQGGIAQIDAGIMAQFGGVGIYLRPDASNVATGTVLMQEGQLTITWAKLAGSPTGTASMTITAEYHN